MLYLFYEIWGDVLYSVHSPHHHLLPQLSVCQQLPTDDVYINCSASLALFEVHVCETF